MHLRELSRPFFVLAPLDDVTDTVFRRIVASCAAPDLFFTEFVNVDGLMSPGRMRLLKKLRFTPGERPLVAQIWGLKPDNFQAIARQISDGSLAHELNLPAGVNFTGIDLNMGCPIKTVVNNGACSGLINNPKLAVEIIKATQAGAAGRLPVSVKTRIGFNDINMEWFVTLLGQNLDMLTVHGRTRKEMSNVPADWGTIGQVRELRDRLASQTLIVGNGDVMSRTQGVELAAKYGLDGIMVGRGVFHDPFIFSSDSPWGNYGKEQRIDLYRRHVQLFADTWRNNEHPTQTLNKFCKIYINNFDGAKELREQLMRASTTDELLSILQITKASQ
jgi:tRNA-dihydrouridine synthase